MNGVLLVLPQVFKMYSGLSTQICNHYCFYNDVVTKLKTTKENTDQTQEDQKVMWCPVLLIHPMLVMTAWYPQSPCPPQQFLREVLQIMERILQC